MLRFRGTLADSNHVMHPTSSLSYWPGDYSSYVLSSLTVPTGYNGPRDWLCDCSKHFRLGTESSWDQEHNAQQKTNTKGLSQHVKLKLSNAAERFCLGQTLADEQLYSWQYGRVYFLCVHDSLYIQRYDGNFCATLLPPNTFKSRVVYLCV